MAKRKLKEPGGNAVIYARYSSHNQREVSLEQQIEKCREYAKDYALGSILLLSLLWRFGIVFLNKTVDIGFTLGFGHVMEALIKKLPFVFGKPG